MSDCGCEEKAAQPAEPVWWDYAAVWERDNAYTVCTTIEHFERLSDTILGVIGVRSDGTTDYVSGYDWYGWFPFPDGTWRVSGHFGDKAENERQRKRYPNTIWKEGILVSDAEMARVSEEMSAYQRSLG